MSDPALLALADGTVFEGISAGRAGISTGEVVFNTALTGYQEILTDPSYYGQLVVLTMPHVGNVGTNAADCESTAPAAAGLIMRNASPTPSSWRFEETLSHFLEARGIVALAEVDTRKLTRHLRDRGAQNGCILAGSDAREGHARAIREALRVPAMAGCDLSHAVSVTEQTAWTEGSWNPGATKDLGRRSRGRGFQVVVYDFGVKRNILRLLVDAGCQVTIVPATSPAERLLQSLHPDGVLFSNGPGDPEAMTDAIARAQAWLSLRIPFFGICLGHQLLALASGARTRKMKFGHHGANHPVVELATGRVWITSQNHGFAVDEADLPAHLTPTHRSLFDGSLQGIERTDVPALGFQGHPEASPGPHDPAGLFDRFLCLMQAHGTNRRPGVDSGAFHA
ncbi:carbamoyl-phosphate synthase, small subunit [mine drainage metagenome]|uniref:carbamoyl-phosphate synthase (glutamine-hydrolyzing) n=2 Tax=mine drainage metagenome TaxID=410659 RepID=T1B9P1_9ZZZZ